MPTFEVGSTLQQERLRQGLSLETIANQTRISQRFLQAIESDNLAILPGIVFARNFVRQFAMQLGMDPAPLLEKLPRAVVEDLPLPDAAQFSRPRRTNVRWATAFSSFLWVALAAGTSTGAYVYFNHEHAASARQTIPPAPATRIESTTAKAQTPHPQAPSVPAVATELTSSPVQVVLKATEASWVQVFADGRNAFTGILQANDSRSVAAKALVKVTAGNAGGIEISLNGKPLDPLGPSGQVRTIRLTAEGPQLVPKSSAASARL